MGQSFSAPTTPFPRNTPPPLLVFSFHFAACLASSYVIPAVFIFRPMLWELDKTLVMWGGRGQARWPSRGLEPTRSVCLRPQTWSAAPRHRALSARQTIAARFNQSWPRTDKKTTRGRWHWLNAAIINDTSTPHRRPGLRIRANHSTAVYHYRLTYHCRAAAIMGNFYHNSGNQKRITSSQ